MPKGKVKWYDETKGYGFIESESGGDIFVHRTGLDNSISGLDTDAPVEYETKQGPKGLVAIDVRVVG